MSMKPAGSGSLHFESPRADDIADGIYVVIADFLCTCLDHDTDERFGTGFADQNSSAVAESVSRSLHRLLNFRIRLCRCLVRYADVLQHLRQDDAVCREL